MDNNNVGRLTEESLKRKERLQKLREQVQNKGTDSSELNEKLPKPVFRSYKPQNENTIGEVLLQEPTGNIESAVETQLNLLQQPMVIDEIDISNLAPRKPDWDLKRDASKKLDRLERRTQKAIAELIRERLKMNQIEDISQAVNVAAAQAGGTSVEDEYD
ncbi:GL13490 [Drosophila persimilis]|uniref:GL13490 n=1 Tax=Drosophila persimilis TaxID=7234 RepID=B4GNG5_DROPE|nr:coiled-coil domain-containing protein 12 [Drosophila persimilis]XP_017141515.1 coiled-coil domain-containing protein 12 [Drosophila miranda]EDW39291.1 GL13490 [Drosophila persimilis]